MPIVIYGRAWQADRELILRALVLANLISVHQKKYIGSLSAYCGATSAATGAACGVAYMMLRQKGEQERIYQILCDTITNSIETLGGMVCDGAKASCAAKIASAVDAGLLGFYMYQNGQQFRGGDGIISKGVEETIRNIGLLATQGMRETDREILDIMTTRC